MNRPQESPCLLTLSCGAGSAHTAVREMQLYGDKCPSVMIKKRSRLYKKQPAQTVQAAFSHYKVCPGGYSHPSAAAQIIRSLSSTFSLKKPMTLMHGFLSSSLSDLLSDIVGIGYARVDKLFDSACDLGVHGVCGFKCGLDILSGLKTCPAQGLLYGRHRFLAGLNKAVKRIKHRDKHIVGRRERFNVLLCAL